MGFLVLLVLLGLPVAEIWLMIEIGGEIGALPTVALILGTAALGALLFRVQGLATLARVRTDLDRGSRRLVSCCPGWASCSPVCCC